MLILKVNTISLNYGVYILSVKDIYCDRYIIWFDFGILYYLYSLEYDVFSNLKLIIFERMKICQ
jgi:hypothetical protein